MNATTTIDEKLPSWRTENRARELFTRMRIYEEAFARCDKMEHPQEWLRLQDELGMVYREVMNKL